MITVIGLGFVGLTTALGLADVGYQVCGIEKDDARRENIADVKVPFFEPGLQEALDVNLGGRFTVTGDYHSIAKSEYVFFCVGTPCDDNGEADLKYIKSAIDSCLKELGDNAPIFVIKSTVPPSTTFDRIRNYIKEQGYVVGKDVYLANNPEFLREGYAWSDFTNPDRIVIGAEDEHAKDVMTALYKPFNAPIHIVSGNTAEFIKYVSNSTLATLISFSNEMAELAETIGDINVADAFHILHEDARWQGGMQHYLYPGCGYGGYCLPKDTTALSAIAKTKGVTTPILDEVIHRNESMAESIAKRISSHITKEQTIGILGLSFKPHSDDVRESPSAGVIKALVDLGYRKFVAYDPVANVVFQKTYTIDADIEYAASMDEVMNKSDIAVILTAWEEFTGLRDRKHDIEVLDYRYIL